MSNKFTPSAEKALNNALETAKKFGHTYIGTEHLLIGILTEKNSTGARLLGARGITLEKTKELVESLEGVGSCSDISASDLSPKLRTVIETAAYSAFRTGGAIGTENLLSAILGETDSAAVRIIRMQNPSVADICGDVIGLESRMNTFSSGSVNKPHRLPKALSEYGVCLTDAAANGELDPVFCRDAETERIIRILLRRTKNNPCLIGEAGVGKTAVAEGLAERIAEGRVPEPLLGVKLITLDLPAMIAGAKYRGEFEERMKNVIAEASSDRNLIIFIDEIHTIVGAGSAEGSVDAANILKPQLARGKIRIIGATTSEEYRRFIEKDPALERRFQPVPICEPDIGQTRQIICGLRPKYELHHSVRISDEAIDEAIKLSVRFMPEKHLPDKAIDIIDEASSGKHLGQSGIGASVDFESRTPPLLTAEDVTRTVSERIRIPILNGNIHISDVSESRLMQRVFGQDEVIKKVVKTLRRSFMGLSEGNKPLAGFIFLGASGVGKTELAGVIAEEVFGSVSSLIRFDMSEYSENHCVSKLLGSPPGYIGHGEEGLLSKKIRNNPRSVILFDEIEKAHPDIFSLLLQAFDCGYVTDSDGRQCDFRNSIIILTSNIGEEESAGISGIIGFSHDTDADSKRTRAEEKLKAFLPTELIGRFDCISVFNTLGMDSAIKIARYAEDKFVARANALGVDVEIPDEVTEITAKLGISKKYGARKIQSAVRENIEDVFAQMITDGTAKSGDKIRFFEKNGIIGAESVTKKYFSHIL